MVFNQQPSTDPQNGSQLNGNDSEGFPSSRVKFHPKIVSLRVRHTLGSGFGGSQLNGNGLSSNLTTGSHEYWVTNTNLA